MNLPHSSSSKKLYLLAVCAAGFYATTKFSNWTTLQYCQGVFQLNYQTKPMHVNVLDCQLLPGFLGFDCHQSIVVVN
jgi:hypothetical protein